MIGLLSAIGRGLSMLRDLIGRPLREWSEWASKNPMAAAEQLEAASTVLRYRASAYRRQNGWRARRDRALAAALKEHASNLRNSALDPARIFSLENRCRDAMRAA